MLEDIVEAQRKRVRALSRRCAWLTAALADTTNSERAARLSEALALVERQLWIERRILADEVEALSLAAI